MTTDRHLPSEGLLFTDFYQLTMAHLYFRQGMHERPALFDYFYPGVLPGSAAEVPEGFHWSQAQGLAYMATPGNIKQIEHQRRVWAARDMKDQQDAEALASRLAGWAEPAGSTTSPTPELAASIDRQAEDPLAGLQLALVAQRLSLIHESWHVRL